MATSSRNDLWTVRPVLVPWDKDNQRPLERFDHRQLVRELYTFPAADGRPTPARIEVVKDLARRGVISNSEARRWIGVGHVGDPPWRRFAELDGAFPPETLGSTWRVIRRQSWSNRLWQATAVIALCAAVALVVMDLLDGSVSSWLHRHSWTSQMIGSAIVVLGTYVIVDRLLTRERATRWRVAAQVPFTRYAEELVQFRRCLRRLFFEVGVSLDEETNGSFLRALCQRDLNARARVKMLSRSLDLLAKRRASLSVLFGADLDLSHLLRELGGIDEYLLRVREWLRQSEALDLAALVLWDDMPDEDAVTDASVEEAVVSDPKSFDVLMNHYLIALHALFGSSGLDKEIQPRLAFDST